MPRVALLVTCVVDVLAPEVGEAAVEVLEAAGCSVSFDAGQTCCGQPAWNAGHAGPAAAVAATTLEAMERELAAGAEAVVVPAGSCAAMVRLGWPELFRAVGDEAAAVRAERVARRTFELTEALVEIGPPPVAVAPTRVAVHHSCHLLRELHGRPDAVLARVDGCEVVGWPDAERCCGFGGLFSVALPEVSEAMADEKLRSLPPDVDAVVSADQSCLVHLRSRAEATGVTGATFTHVAELLAGGLERG